MNRIRNKNRNKNRNRNEEILFLWIRMNRK